MNLLRRYIETRVVELAELQNDERTAELQERCNQLYVERNAAKEKLADVRLDLSDAAAARNEMKARLLLSEQDNDRLTAEKTAMAAGFEEQATAIDALHEAQNTGLGNEIARLRIELAEAGAVRATADGAHMCAYPDSAR